MSDIRGHAFAASSVIPAKREGGFTFQVQRLFEEYFGWGLIVKALARRVIVRLG